MLPLGQSAPEAPNVKAQHEMLGCKWK